MAGTAETIEIAAAGIAAGINPLGAELSWLRDEAGRDLLWDGDPAFWSGRAPILFPIVGGLNGDSYRYDGRRYTLLKHGFARRSRFAPIEQHADSATFRLEADAETRAAYLFDFRLDIRFAASAAALRIVATVTNLGDRVMPASFGYHPAFRWPLPYGRPRAEHRLLFDTPEPAPVRRLDAAGLLDPAPRPTPISGHVLPLDDGLFVDDAIILDAPISRALRYGAADGPQLRISWPEMPMLGIWTKPGAGYICVEPWHGIADPAGFDGDIAAKPGIMLLPPGEARDFAMRIAIEG